MSTETNEARIEAIRARHADRLRTRADATTPPSLVSTLMDDDMAVLLAELDYVQGVNDDQNHEIAECRVLEYEARMKEAEEKVQRVWALVHRFEQWPSSPSLAVAARHLREVLAPVAPDAEPGGAR